MRKITVLALLFLLLIPKMSLSQNDTLGNGRLLHMSFAEWCKSNEANGNNYMQSYHSLKTPEIACRKAFLDTLPEIPYQIVVIVEFQEEIYTTITEQGQKESHSKCSGMLISTMIQ